MSQKTWMACGLCLSWAAGCASPRPSAVNYNVVTLSGATDLAAMDAAEGALAEHFTLARREAGTQTLTTLPTESEAVGGGERIGDVIGARRRERRYAEVRIEPAGSSVKVYCKVLVQEYDTDAHQVFSRDHATTDLPGDTPADRDAATTTEQNAVWRTKRRDKELERRILRDIQERLGGAEAS